MNKKLKMIYLLLILTLNSSCTEKKSTEKVDKNSELVITLKTDSLKFTSRIRAIFQDSKGNYWFGSHQEGVCVFDGKSFEYFTTNEGLPDNQVRSIQEDKNGNIWFGTANGVSSYDGDKITNHIPITDDYLQNEIKKTDNNLWFNAGNNAGVYRNNGQILNYLAFPTPENENLNNSYGVTGISKGQDGQLWIATYAALFNFDGKAVNVFDQSKLALKKGEELHIRSVFADSQGRIWIGNNGIGVLLFQGDSVINFSDKNGLIHTNSSKNGNTSPIGTLEHVFAIEEDSEGNIWFGDRDSGAWKYDGRTLKNYSISDTRSKPMIWTIYKDKKNNLLFGMDDGNILKFNGKTFEKHF
ncbi:MAG: diguanylate cyclase [Bacteroidetes bacterium]|nr:diguanylate cyclase [Bacteroidota bacterium]